MAEPDLTPGWQVTAFGETRSSLSDALAAAREHAETTIVAPDGARTWNLADAQWRSEAASAICDGAYLVEATWFPLPDGSDRAYQPEPLREHHSELRAADNRGMRWGCMNGIARVEVYSPDGVLQSLWDKQAVETRRETEPCWVDEETGEKRYDTVRMSSRWQSLGAESRSLAQERAADARRQFAALHVR